MLFLKLKYFFFTIHDMLHVTVHIDFISILLFNKWLQRLRCSTPICMLKKPALSAGRRLRAGGCGLQAEGRRLRAAGRVSSSLPSQALQRACSYPAQAFCETCGGPAEVVDQTSAGFSKCRLWPHLGRVNIRCTLTKNVLQ